MSSAVFCHSGSIQCLPVKNILQKRKTPFKAFSPILLQKPSWVLLSGRYSSPSNTISSYSHSRRMPFHFKHSSNIHRLSSSLGNDVALQKSDTDTVDAANDNSPKETELKQVAAGLEGESISAGTSSDSKRARPSGVIKRNTNPQIKDDQLVPGAVFTGKVRSVQSYGAFVEFGASTQGLVHISRISKSYVNDIKEVLSVGQEVTVKIEEANLESGRISLTMLIDEDLDQDEASDNDNENAGQRQKSSRRFGRNKGKEPELISKFEKGQVLEGKVKGFVPNGAIIELPENEEGFLPTSELSDDFTSLNGEMLLTRSQKVTVQVVRMEKGRVRLTMNVKEKTQTNAFSMVEQEVASNPFELAFRKHPIISTFLTKKEENLESSSIAQHVDASMATADLVDNEKTFEGVLKDTQDVTEGSGSSEAKSLPSVPETNDQVGLSNKMDVMDGLSGGNGDLENENASLNLNTKIDEFASSRDTNLASADVDPNVVATSGDTSLASASVEPNIISASELEAKANLNSVVISNTGNISASLVKQLREETGAGMMDCKKALNETSGDIEKAREFLRKKGLASAEKKATRVAAEGRIGSYIHDSRIGVLLEVNCETDFVSRGDIFWELVEDLAMQIAACPNVKYVSAEDVPDDIVKREREIELQKEDLLSKPEQIREKIVDGRIGKIVSELALLKQPYIKNDKLSVEDMIKQRIATVGENIRVRRFVRYNLGEGLEKKSQDLAAEVAAQTTSTTPAMPPKNPEDNGNAAGSRAMETLPVKEAPVIPATLVRQLREETGAGMMDCKKALTETAGDLALAQEFLRKKGLASADKKSSRIAAEGRVGSYVHDSRIGVLIEVNCETDFVARGDAFKQLVEDLAMQVVASSQVQYVSVDDIPKEYQDREKEIEMQRVDLQSKPQEIREKIVDGRVTKRLGELALLEQPFIKDDKFLVKDIVKQAIAKLGENIQVRRFTRYNLGEGLEKKVNDFSTEIAEQTKSKTQA